MRFTINTRFFKTFLMTAALLIFAAHTQVAAQDHTGHAEMGDMPYDLHFIDMMMMHHREGVEMARLAEERSRNARVKAFAVKTIEAQEKDLRQLQWHRDNLYSGRPVMDHAQMMAHMEKMPGHGGMKGGMMMDMEGDMKKLRAAEGAAFDRLFIDTMTHHHAMAVEMSKEATTKAAHAEVKEFARKSAAAQQGEIAEMKALRASLGGSASKKATVKRKPAAKKPAAKKSSAHSGHSNH